MDVPQVRCLGSGTYVPFGWSWYPCPDCGAAVWRDPDILGLVDHSPGSRGEQPVENEPSGGPRTVDEG